MAILNDRFPGDTVTLTFWRFRCGLIDVSAKEIKWGTGLDHGWSFHNDLIEPVTNSCGS